VALSEQVFQILLSLASGDLHGYAIIQDVRARTGGAMRLTASTLYAALKRLLDARLIEEIDPPPANGDSRRRLYRLTKAGERAGRQEAARLEMLAGLARERRWLPQRRGAR
jgi:DNA-binding PadR family transcriptional regulator